MRHLQKIPLHNQIAILRKIRRDAIYEDSGVRYEDATDYSSDSSRKFACKKMVKITANHSINSFYVRSFSAHDEFHEMQTFLSCLKRDELVDFRFYPLPKVGERCLCVDTDRNFYRGSIECVTRKQRSSEYNIRIVFIDVGKRIDVNDDESRLRVKKLPERFQSHPPLVRQFQLYGMDRSDQSRWDTDNRREHIDFIFQMLTKAKDLSMEIKESGEIFKL